MIRANLTVQILPATNFDHRVPGALWSQISLYSQPWFMEAVAPGKGHYALVSLSNQPDKTAIFPFCGHKIGWKWRLFQPSFCQRFQPFSTDNQPIEEVLWRAWFDFLEKKTWAGHWPFEMPNTLNYSLFTSVRITKKPNFIYPILDELVEMLAKWKPGRRNTLKKTSPLSIQLLNSAQLMQEIQAFCMDGERLWRPTSKEREILKKIVYSAEKEVFAYKIELEKKTVALSLILQWGNRLHYLMGMSNSNGLKLEAMPFFFKELMDEWKGSGKTLDFEGSSLPGVAKFFKSMGAEEEEYFLWTK